MRILFLYPDMVSTDPSWTGYYYEGIAVLSAVARAAGHETRLLHVHHDLSDEEVLSWVQENRDGDDTLLAFSSTTNQYPYIRRWAPLLKRETGLLTLAGGMHPTLSPEDAIEADGVDLICKGDGETPLVEVANRLAGGAGLPDLEDIQGIWVKRPDGEVVRQCSAPLANIDSLPMPHWEIYPNYEGLMVVRENIGIHMGSRGCPYDCAYCCNKALIDDAKGVGKFMRFKDVGILMEELKVYLERYPDTWSFFFEDDIFGVSKRWLKEFAPRYKAEIGRPFGCNMRPNLVDDWMVQTLAEAGCVRVHMAIEAGNEEVRNAILNRRLSHEKLVESFLAFKRAGIQVMSYNIVGSPHETPEQILDTIKVNAEIDPDFIQHSIFYPYEGTPLYTLVSEEGLWAKDREVTDYFSDTALEQDCISRDQVLMFQQNFKGLVSFYKRLRNLPNPLERVATAAMDRFLTWKHAPSVMRMRKNGTDRDQRDAAAEVAC